MLFNSFHFLIFFAVVFSVYWALGNHRARLTWLLAASCFFYMSWNPWFILLILFSASVDYVVALQLEKPARAFTRQTLLILSISVNLGLLAYFKYANFLMDAASTGLNLFGFGVEPRILHLILPLGISFYTFETISYVVDVYLGRARPIRNPLDYALYIMFFPHLVAGPIVRPREFLPQLAQSKRWSWTRLELGGRLFLLGFIKKAVIADRLAPVADMVFEKPEVFGSSAVWLGVLSYSVQIYCDFSGYSDMAIGLAHSLGFKLPCNFRLPYLSDNIGEFWRRWHITLSTWLRDYLYIPLGGNRFGRWNTYRNLIVTMFLGGLWHGASWTFAAWGLYHGALLALHKALPRPAWLAPLRVRPVAVAMTFLSVCIGWVFFRAQSFADAALILERMFRPISGASIPAVDALIALSCLALVFFCHLGTQLVDVERITRVVPLPVMGATFALLILFVQMFASIKNQTFIYFQF